MSIPGALCERRILTADYLETCFKEQNISYCERRIEEDKQSLKREKSCIWEICVGMEYNRAKRTKHLRGADVACMCSQRKKKNGRHKKNSCPFYNTVSKASLLVSTFMLISLDRRCSTSSKYNRLRAKISLKSVVKLTNDKTWRFISAAPWKKGNTHGVIESLFSISLCRPRSKGEYLFVIAQLLFGLLLFATVLGHVANIVTSVSAARKEFQGEWKADPIISLALASFSQRKNRAPRTTIAIVPGAIVPFWETFVARHRSIVPRACASWFAVNTAQRRIFLFVRAAVKRNTRVKTCHDTCSDISASQRT